MAVTDDVRSFSSAGSGGQVVAPHHAPIKEGTRNQDEEAPLVLKSRPTAKTACGKSYYCCSSKIVSRIIVSMTLLLGTSQPQSLPSPRQLVLQVSREINDRVGRIVVPHEILQTLQTRPGFSRASDGGAPRASLAWDPGTQATRLRYPTEATGHEVAAHPARKTAAIQGAGPWRCYTCLRCFYDRKSCRKSGTVSRKRHGVPVG